MENFDPDIVVFQDFINAGRKPFLTRQHLLPDIRDAHLKELFKLNPELYKENTPPFGFENTFFQPLHYKLIELSSAYRLGCALYNRSNTFFYFPHHSFFCTKDKDTCEKVSDKYLKYGQLVNLREFRKFKKQYKTKIAFFDPINNSFCENELQLFEGAPAFSVCQKDRGDKTYKMVHPPPHVYEVYAQKIYENLNKLGWL